MKTKELKQILELFNENNDVIVFNSDNATLYDVESVSDNNGHLQINIIE